MIERTGDLWWKNAIVYCLDAETFADSDGDGCGDLPGLTERIDYLAGIGVTCLWLMPFYPSANRDDGYDIVDFLGVDPRLGTPADLVELVRTARDRGIRVIADLVVNHTSDQHPWFQAARADRDSPYRDFYVWADAPPPGAEKIAPVLPGRRGQRLDLRRGGRAVLPPPLLPPPARPERRQPGGARRHRRGHRLLAGPGAVGLPHRRGPVPDRDPRAGGRRRPRPPRADPRDARLRVAARRRPCAAGGGEPAAGRDRGTTSAPARATSCRCCSPSRSCRRCTSRSPAARPARWRPRCASCRRSPTRASGRTSCATTTS